MASNREREELHKAIWAIADDLRGSVDGWDFKQYILGIMFYRYISENITNYINEGERKAGDATFDYAKLKDNEAESERENLVKEKGFFIRPSELFCNVIKSAKSDSSTFVDVEGKTKSVKDNLNEYLEMIFNNIENSAKGAESEDNFAGLFDDIDVNSNKLGATVTKRNDKLIKILDGIANINLGNYQDNNIDAFGDAYEFLMSMYASNAGKSGGEFYTPQEVSDLLTRLAIVGKTSVNKIYDPACGSGSLLLKAAKILGKDNVRNGFFGQEVNLTTYNLCRINMFLHDVDYDKFDIACEDTLISPQHWDDEPFEVIVSNPPYSIKWVGDDDSLLINDVRYSPAGVLAPKSKADFAFIMHSLSWLATNGVASIVCFPGILYRGGAEQKIRKYLIDNNFIDCIIQLPENLFFGTGIPTCIMVLKKSKNDNKTLFIDASNEFVKANNNNLLSPENINKIVKIFENRENVENIARLVSNTEISEKEYNLSVSAYVETEDTTIKVDINKLSSELDEIVKKQLEVRNKIIDMQNQIAGKEIEKLIEQFCPNGIEYYEMGKVGKFYGGLTGKSKDDFTDGNAKFITYKNVYSNLSLDINVEDTVKINADENQRTLEYGDVLFTGSSETPDECGISSVLTTKTEEKLYLNSFCFIYRFDDKNMMDPEFSKHLFRSNNLRKQIGKTANGVTRYNVSKKLMEKVIIPVPPLEVQKQIAHILDNLTLLTEELSRNLSVELKNRQLQYEYYKNHLLDFERKD